MAPNKPVSMSDRLWFGLSRWTWLILYITFIFTVVVFALFLMQRNFKEDNTRFRAAALHDHFLQDTRAYEQCLSANKVRTQMRALIVFAYSQGGGSVDLTAVPSFAKLDSQTKQWVTELNDVFNQPANQQNNQQRINDALANIPLDNCGTKPVQPKG